MIEYFKEEQWHQAHKQYKQTLLAYWIVLGLYALASIGLIIWYTTLPYMSETITTVKIIHYALTVIMVIFSFIYIGIPITRVKCFYKLNKNLSEGIKETTIGNFFEYQESIQIKDGVDFKALIFLEWNKYKNDYYERKVLVFAEKDLPQIELNATVKYITQGNVLISYEILENQTQSEGEEQWKL